MDKVNRQIIKSVDVNKINTSDKIIGWARGLEIVEDYAFLGISKLRKSKFKEYTNWILRDIRRTMPSSIIQIDLKKSKIIDCYELENYHGHAIFTILKHPS